MKVLLPSLILLFSLDVLAFWIPSWSEEDHRDTLQWARGASPPRQNLTLRIGLRPAHPGKLEKRLTEISDPNHATYTEFLSRREVQELVRPSDHAIRRVQTWLREIGVTGDAQSLSEGEDCITATLTASEVDNLRRTQYQDYSDGEITGIQALSFSPPPDLDDVIEVIYSANPLTHPPSRLRGTSRGKDPEDAVINSLNDVAVKVDEGVGNQVDVHNIPPNLTARKACNTSAVTSLCLRVLYGTLQYKVQVPHANRMALVNYLGEFNSRADIATFPTVYRPDAVSAADTFQDISIAGGINRQTPFTQEEELRGAGREGNLDAQAMLGIAHPTPLITYTVGDVQPPFAPDASTETNTNEPFLTWLDWLLSRPDSELPTVVSTSYADIEETVPLPYAQRVCRGFAQLGARGISVIMGAGDQGVGRTGEGVSNDGSHTSRFQVKFPESCPWVTSVGATRNIDPEVVAVNEANGFVSGGGFSNYFPRPDYQKRIESGVRRYLSHIGDMHSGMLNPEGRAYRDVAVQGYRYATIWNGETRLVDGTSASTPAFAAIVALVNDALIAGGQPTLGFMNPWLYSEGYKAFRDVREGSTSGCNTTGFPATRGWDAASGWGTPWFPTFRDLALNRRVKESRPWYVQWSVCT